MLTVVRDFDQSFQRKINQHIIPSRFVTAHFAVVGVDLVGDEVWGQDTAAGTLADNGDAPLVATAIAEL